MIAEPKKKQIAEPRKEALKPTQFKTLNDEYDSEFLDAPIPDAKALKPAAKTKKKKKVLSDVENRNGHSKSVMHDDISNKKALKLNDILCNPLPTKYKKYKKQNQFASTEEEQYDVRADVDHYNLQSRYELDEMIQHRLKKHQERGEELQQNRRSKSIAPSNSNLNLPPIVSIYRQHETSMNHYLTNSASPRELEGFDANIAHMPEHPGMIPSITQRRNETKQKIAHKSNHSDDYDQLYINSPSIISGAKMITPYDLMPKPVHIEYEPLMDIENHHHSSYVSLPGANKVSRKV